MRISVLLPASVSPRKSAAAVLLLLMAAATHRSLGAVPNAGSDAATYIIASANTSSHLTDEGAKLRLESVAQQNIVAVADRMTCALTHSASIGNALGVYANSSENSFVVETDLTGQLSRYLASLLGRYAHQKYVLLFTPGPGGPDKLWFVDSSRSLSEIVSALRNSGIAAATVRREQNRTQALVVDFGAHSTERLGAFVSAVHGKASVTAGVATLLGDDDRQRAAAYFDAEIRDVERKGKHHLSAQLWTPAWHHATSRTCSHSLPIGP